MACSAVQLMCQGRVAAGRRVHAQSTHTQPTAALPLTLRSCHCIRRPPPSTQAPCHHHHHYHYCRHSSIAAVSPDVCRMPRTTVESPPSTPRMCQQHVYTPYVLLSACQSHTHRYSCSGRTGGCGSGSSVGSKNHTTRSQSLSVRARPHPHKCDTT